MSNTAFDRKEVVEGPLKWVFDKEYDDSPDLSWLGDFVNKNPNYPYFDRANDTLVISSKEEEVHSPDTDEIFNKITYQAYQASGKMDNLVVTKVDYDPEEGSVNRGEYRYIHAFQNDCNDGTEEEKLASIRACLWDAKRLIAYGDSWQSIGLCVRLIIDGHEVDSASTRGIESDLDDGYEKEVYDDLKTEIKLRFKEKSKELIKEAKRETARANLLAKLAE